MLAVISIITIFNFRTETPAGKCNNESDKTTIANLEFTLKTDIQKCAIGCMLDGKGCL